MFLSYIFYERILNVHFFFHMTHVILSFLSVHVRICHYVLHHKSCNQGLLTKKTKQNNTVNLNTTHLGHVGQFSLCNISPFGFHKQRRQICFYQHLQYNYSYNSFKPSTKLSLNINVHDRLRASLKKDF